VNELRNWIKTRAPRDVWDASPDWTMLAISVALLVGWALWLGVIAYRLLVP